MDAVFPKHVYATRGRCHAGDFLVFLVGNRTNLTVLPSTSQTIRWSSGIYCTAWRTGKPAGQSVLPVFHDQARLASSYTLAEPANW